MAEGIRKEFRLLAKVILNQRFYRHCDRFCRWKGKFFEIDCTVEERPIPISILAFVRR